MHKPRRPGIQAVVATPAQTPQPPSHFQKREAVHRAKRTTNEIKGLKAKLTTNEIKGLKTNQIAFQARLKIIWGGFQSSVTLDIIDFLDMTEDLSVDPARAPQHPGVQAVSVAPARAVATPWSYPSSPP